MNEGVLLAAFRLRVTRQYEAFVEACIPGGDGPYDKSKVVGEHRRW